MATSAPAAGPGGGADNPLLRRPGATRSRFRFSGFIRWAGLGGAIIPLLLLAFILITLLIEAIPAIKFNGLRFLTGSTWTFGAQYGTPINSGGIVHQPGEQFGALPQIVGTLESSAIALIIGVPVSVGAALMIVERLPKRLAHTLGLFLEVLAGIPSVVIGLWGALTFGPFLAHHLTPWIAEHAPDVPVLSFFRGEAGEGQGLLTSGIILAVMIIPIVASTTRDLIRGVPILPREGAIALGMSDFECARRVTLPWVSTGIVGASVLGLGRALGETIAVAMVAGGNLSQIPSNLYASMSTIAANIVQNLDTAIINPLGTRTYAELALVLMVITLAANILARLMVRRVSGTALPVGRGL